MKKLLIIPAFLVAMTGVAFAGGYGGGSSTVVSHNKVEIKNSFNTATANGNTSTVTANTSTKFAGGENGAAVQINTVTQTIY